MFFTDSHTHLFLPQFDNDRDDVIKKAINNNVKYFVIPNIDIHSIEGVRNICNKYPNNCYPTIGLHPGSVKDDFESQLEIIENEILKEKVFGIGEVGLDYYWDKTFEEEQILAFTTQIKWSIKYDLPLVIHVRNSFEHVINILKNNYSPQLKGVFHCFTGTFDQAQEVFELGFHIGIGGIVTFKNSGLDNTLSSLSPEKIVLETDSPYLAPTPYRGKRNESSYISIIANKLADIYNITIEEIADITNKNIKEIFKINF